MVSRTPRSNCGGRPHACHDASERLYYVTQSRAFEDRGPGCRLLVYVDGRGDAVPEPAVRMIWMRLHLRSPQPRDFRGAPAMLPINSQSPLRGRMAHHRVAVLLQVRRQLDAQRVLDLRGLRQRR